MLKWYTLHYKHFSYGILKSELIRREIEYYDPYIRIDQRGKKILKPLFPTYMFLRFDADRGDWYRLRYVQGVKYVLPKDSTPVSIRDDYIEWIRQRVEVHNSGAIDLAKKLQQGDKVTVSNGPLQSLEEVFQEHSSKGRCTILLQFFNEYRPVEIEAASLDKV